MVYSFDLNLIPGGVPELVKLSQYDYSVPELQFTLWDGNQAYTIPSGSVCYVVGTKPDNTGFQYTCSYSGSVVTVEVTEQMTAVAGRVPCEIVIMKDDGRKGSANFFLDVEPCAMRSDVTPSETDIPIIERLPEIIAELEQTVYEAEEWAVGPSGSGTEEPSDTNNSYYWHNQSKLWAVGPHGSGESSPSATNNAYYWAMRAASAAGGGLQPAVVQTLPTTDISTSTLYFVPSQNPTASNYYDEYINLDGTTQGWECIGTTAIDMSNYYTKAETKALIVYPHFIISADTGSTVTATKGQTVITATETSTGVYECDVTDYGTWVVTTTSGGVSATTNVVVDDVKIYEVTGRVVPDGSTVTPTDDVQTLLNCANIWDKDYTTLTELLADTTTLASVINSNNAIDYLVRSKTLVTDTCANSNAMSYIGLNNYASNTLLADTNEGLVPVMTSDTTPSGEAFRSSGRSSYPAWKIFDRDSTTYSEITNAVGEYIGYEFPSDTVVKSLSIEAEVSSGTQFYIEGSNSKTGTYTVLGEFTGIGALKTVTFQNSTPYKCYRLRVKTKTETWIYIGIYTLQFYPASWLEGICNSTYFESVLNVKVPTMTSNTTPSGVVSANASWSGSDHYPWHAFDGNSTYWASPNTSVGLRRLTYTFPHTVKVYKVSMVSSGVWTIEEGSSNTQIGTITTADPDWVSVIVSGNSNIYSVSQNQDTASNYVYVREMNYYGREDV